MIAKNFNPIAEIAVSTAIQTNEVNKEFETSPLNAKTETKKWSK